MAAKLPVFSVAINSDTARGWKDEKEDKPRGSKIALAIAALIRSIEALQQGGQCNEEEKQHNLRPCGSQRRR
jgi:hypothetical protein